MSPNKIIINIIILTLIFNLSLSGVPKVFDNIKAIESQQGNLKMTPSHYRRRMQKTAGWRPIKIYFDMTKLNNQNRKQVEFYQKVFSICGEWYGGALYVRDDQSKILPFVNKMVNRGEEEKFASSNLQSYDLLIHVHMARNDGSAMAWAGPRLRHPDSQRPITGETAVTWFGDNTFMEMEDSINRAVGTIIHEFAHVIAFISFDQYQARYTKYDRASKVWYFNGPKTVKAMGNYYGCTAAEVGKGMPIETMSRREPGGHWQEAALNDELMTPVGGEEPEKVSPMTMAMFEDSGWYKSNYRYVENYTYRKGAGCKGLGNKSSCPNPPICKPRTQGFVTSSYKGIGYCEKDMSGCLNEQTYSNRNCMNEVEWERWFKNFGPTYGGNCT